MASPATRATMSLSVLPPCVAGAGLGGVCGALAGAGAGAGSAFGPLALAALPGAVARAACSRSAAQAAGSFTGSGLGIAARQPSVAVRTRSESMRVTMVGVRGRRVCPIGPARGSASSADELARYRARRQGQRREAHQAHQRLDLARREPGRTAADHALARQT